MLKVLTVAVATVAASATVADAQTIAALVDGTSIVMVDGKKKVIKGSVVVDGGARLVGIDVRPADGRLYGLTADGVVVTVDPGTGKWQKKSQLSEKLPASGPFTVDFNPVADRLRVMAADGTNYRVNVDDGKTIVDGRLAFAEADMHKGKKPNVVAGGYTDSYAGTKSTVLYDIDATIGALLKQAPPNDGILNAVGKLGSMVGADVAFDILSDGKGGNTAWLLAGNTLHTVDLASGKATATGAIAGLKGKVVDISLLPTMSGSM